MLSLVMILKNEAASIEAVLTAAKPFIDRATILDTGSTDGTQELVKKALKGIPFKLYEESFAGFAASRNRVMELDCQAAKDAGQGQYGDSYIWQLMLSGDEYLETRVTSGMSFRNVVSNLKVSSGEPECYRIRVVIDEADSLCSPRLFLAGSKWHYAEDELGLHEFPTHPDPEAKVDDVPWEDMSILHRASDPMGRLQNIADVHIPKLEAVLEANPHNSRALTHLAQSYESLFSMMQPHEVQEYAIKNMGLYLRRLSLDTPTSDAERNFLRYRYLHNARFTNVYSPEEIFSRAKQLAEEDPQRPDTILLLVHAAHVAKVPAAKLYELARHAADVAKAAKNIPNPSPSSTHVEWSAHLIAAKCAKVLSKKDATVRRKIPAGDGELFADLVKEHVKLGLATGGKWETFQKVIYDEEGEPVITEFVATDGDVAGNVSVSQ